MSEFKDSLISYYQYRHSVNNDLIDIDKCDLFYYLHSRLLDPDPKIINKIKYLLKDKSSDRILITGPAGSGKSVLLRQVLQELNYREKKKNILLIEAKCIDSSIIEKLSLQDLQDKILLIDGIDEASYENLQYIKWLVSNCQSCVATIRVVTIRGPIDNKYWSIISWFNSTIDIEEYSQGLIRESFNIRLFRDYRLFNERVATEYRDVCLKERLINEEKLEETLEKTLQAYDESGKILLYNPPIEIPKKEIALPPKEIINGVNVLQTSLVEIVQRYPDFIYEMSYRQFEKFVAEMYEKQGYRVELTKMTRDGGKDLILYADGPTGHNMFYIECKKYQKSHLVNVGIVRNFYGVVEADKATAGILVTSSSFTPDARSFEKQVFHRMTLVDYKDLLNQVARIKV